MAIPRLKHKHNPSHSSQQLPRLLRLHRTLTLPTADTDLLKAEWPVGYRLPSVLHTTTCMNFPCQYHRQPSPSSKFSTSLLQGIAGTRSPCQVRRDTDRLCSALPDVNGLKFEYFESNISKFQKHIYPNLGPANLVGYNATSPGPTYKVERGTHIVKRFTNYNDLSSVVHLHGSASKCKAACTCTSFGDLTVSLRSALCLGWLGG